MSSLDRKSWNKAEAYTFEYEVGELVYAVFSYSFFKNQNIESGDIGTIINRFPGETALSHSYDVFFHKQEDRYTILENHLRRFEE